MKKIIILTLILMLFICPYSQAKEVVISPWAILDVTDFEKTAIFTKSSTLSNFSDTISPKDLDEIVTNTNLKLKSYNIEEHPNFNELNSYSTGTREEVLIAIYNCFVKYEQTLPKNYIEYLLEKKILKGSGNSLNLNSPATLEETIIFFNRALIHFVEEKDLATQGFFWKIENKGNSIYLLGSIHLGSKEIYPLSSQILKHFYSADALYVESNSLKSNISYLIQSQKSDGNISTYLTPQYENSVHEILKDYPKDHYDNMKPWALYQLLSNKLINNYEKRSLQGIDRFFLEKAFLLNIPILEFESAKSQIDLLKNFPQDEYIEMIKEIAREPEKAAEKSNTILNEFSKAWTDSDKDKFITTMKLDNSNFSKNLFTNRDVEFTNKIDSILQSQDKKSYFVVLGAAHFLGENNILNNLEERGYKVEYLSNK